MNNGLCDRFCPPLMNDGRHVTDYRPSCYVHDLMLRQNGIRSSYELKQFLQTNAVVLQQRNREFYDCKNKCASGNDYFLADPNNHIAYWDKYDKHIGHNGALSS